MGNSEVGHTNIGAGRVVYQDLVRIEKAIESETIKGNRKLLEFIERLKANGSSVHFLGLLSDGGVHSHINHLKGLLKIFKDSGIKDAYIHAFMDGRDTPPTSGEGYLKEIIDFTDGISFGTLQQ